MTAFVERSPIRVVGRYALYHEIAAGGMATIHLGRLLGPVGFARTVAVKRLHPQYAKDPEFVSMFLDEARLAARVQHPNVVATIDVVATDGELFLIMDYVRGESLSKILRAARKAGQRVPPRIAAAIMCGFLHGLHAAHEAKNERGEPLSLVHRDVSPQNVLVGADGIARVLDFGIAKAQGRIQVTREGQIKGKLAYMPPEQLTARSVSRAVDIYASAVVMWETLTGERLFKGETERDTLAKILRDPVPPPSAILPSLPLEFDAPLLRALSRDADKRHATAKDLARELEKCCGIASPTEVGEWVDGLVGNVLDAREAQIAEIESSSAGMTVPQELRSSGTLTDTTSDGSMPSAQAILSAMRPADTLPAGSSSGMLTAPNGLVPGSTASANTFASTPMRSQLPTLSASRPLSALATAPIEETTGSASHFGSRLTAASLALPANIKLPLLASMFGLLVLLTTVGIVVAGKFSSADTEAPEPSESASAPLAPKTAATAPAATAPPASTGYEPSVPSAEEERAAPSGDANGSAQREPPTGATPRPSAPATPAATAATASARPAPKATAATPPPPKSTVSRPASGCDPPYTIDASGRKKYKLECL